MKWRVTGADRATGEDKTVEVEAHDEHQAQLRAKSLNLLVEKMEMTTVVPAYQAPEPRRELADGYNDLSGASASLSGLGSVVSAVGWLAIVVGLLAAVFGLMASLSKGPGSIDGATTTALMIGGLSALGWGLMVLLAGELTRMIAAMGRAVRELTINSRRFK